MKIISQRCKPCNCTWVTLLPVGIFHADIEGHYLSVNDRLCEIAGVTAAEAQGEGWTQTLHPDDKERVFAEWYQAVQENLPFQSEYQFQRPDGKITWVLAQAIPEKNDTGAVIGYVGTVTNISERKKTEEELRENCHNLQELLEERTAELRRAKEQLQQEIADRKRVEEVQARLVAILEATTDLTVTADLNGHAHYINTVSRELVEVEAQREILMDIPDFHPSGEREKMLYEGLLQTKLTTNSPWGDPEENISGLIGIARTINDCASSFKVTPLTCSAEGNCKQAQEALREQFLREQLIARISQRIHQSLNLEEILNTTVAEVRKFLRSDRVIIYRLHSNGSGVVVVESVGSDWRPIAGTIIEDCYFAENYFQLYQQGRVQSIENIYTAGLTPCHADLLEKFQVKANLVVPIVQDEHLWGLLVAQQCRGTRQWQPLEIDLLKSLATQAAIAIQKSELYQHSQVEIAQRQQAEVALQQQFLKERLMAQSAQRIRQSLNLEDILNTTVAEVRQFLACDRALVFRFEPDWSGIVAVESVDEACTSILGTSIYDPCFEISHVQPYQEGRVKATPDIYSAGLTQCHIDLLAQFQVKANLVVPLIQGKQLWGLLIAHHCSEPRQWQEFEIDLLKSLATQVAIALQQAELYQQSRTATAKAVTQAQQLEQTLQELQTTQGQLVQSEKMSSLGQLVAGVAHEINNPVTFIYANLTHAENYTQNILGLLELYQQQYPDPTTEISEEIEAIDLDFLIEDLPKLMDSMKVGAERICEIVSALRNFSRLAEAEIKAVDIHEGLDSTLTILQSRLKAQGKHPGIQVIKDYGQLPKVECYAGQLNQVFMNLLSNAIDALDEQNQRRTLDESTANPSIIRIQTEVLDNHQIAIRIADNGPGMNEQVKARIFDPFFTTKAVGAGTGLGLSISYQIVVEKHGGQLHCVSQVGQGTEFVIQIPLLTK
jgi:hypothetical protein